MAKTFTYELEILEHHLDTFGHVNHAVYLELFEEARWDLITKGGMGLKEIQAAKIGPVVLEAHVKYRKELKLRERIRIETVCTDYGRLVGTLEHRLYNQEGLLSSLAEMRFGLFDLGARKLLPPTPEWLRAVGFLD